MATGSISLKMALTGEDKLTGIIEKTNTQMSKFRKGTASTGKQVTSSFATIKGQISGVNNKFTEMNSKVALLKQGFEAVKMAAEHAIGGEIASNASLVFEQIAGGAENASKIIKKLRSVSRGLLDETTVKQFTGGLVIAGVEVKEIARIMKISADVSLATGEEMTAMMEKLRVAAIEGSQGEFDKLGLTINVNEELIKRMALEGKLLSDMTKNEQVTARLDILMDQLATTMSAAGIDTSQLSTEMRTLETDLKNLTDTAEKGLFGVLSDDAREKSFEKIKKHIEVIEGVGDIINGSVPLGAMKQTRGLIIKLASDLGLTEKQVSEVLEKHGKQLRGNISAYKAAQLFLPLVLQAQIDLRTGEKKLAQDKINEQLKEKEANASRVRELIKENRKLEIAILGMNSSELAAERLKMKQRLEINRTTIAKIMGMAQGEFDHKIDLINKSSGIEIGLAKKAAKDKSAAAKKAEDDRKKAAAVAWKSRKEAAKKAELDLNKIETDTMGIGLQIKIDGHRREGRLEAAHRLEIKKATLKNESDIENEFKIGAEKKANLLMVQRKGEIDMIVRHGSEVEKAQEAANKILFDASKKAGEDAAAEKQENMEILIGQTKEYADALNMLQGPLVSLVDHQMGASQELKVFGGALGATSAAANVFVAEADASKTATENFTKSLPGAVSAGGSAASAFVKQTKHKALIQGGFEAASSIASFATGNVIGGAGHAASAALFFALAGKSAQGGKGSGSSATKTGALSSGGGGSSGLSASGKGSSVVVNVQGFALGSAKEMGAKMAQTIDQARDTGLDSSEV